MSYLAVYMPEWGRDDHPAFESWEEANAFINGKLCRPGCESCRAEWEIVDADEFANCETLDHLLGCVGYKITNNRGADMEKMVCSCDEQIHRRPNGYLECFGCGRLFCGVCNEDLDEIHMRCYGCGKIYLKEME